MFAAEFLTSRESILPRLPGRVDPRRLAELARVWGVSVRSLLCRCRETGLLSDAGARRGISAAARGLGADEVRAWFSRVRTSFVATFRGPARRGSEPT